ncbi:magnesium transporter MRS2-5-like [Chenopodium quinoa]|uniref:magnesium transporter MRS2-5-like n=1 Tax=Chenopodium quinoa TaxID=63459 RepID=UPI000B77EE6D|nr:magnesium transporter MRS2-5-like [Chenopodium quinoa]XP_021756749.1 magnesium transporter MRS2-5-like [Chenopodium quinoa]XP_021756758.1 magnesium transporter MRS2-5-like [Chenopodium quinoa]
MEKSENSNKGVPSGGARAGAFGHAFGYSGVKKRGHGSRSWIKIEQNGNAKVMELDKSTIMKNCSLPSRDLRLLDPLFIYPSAILGREKAIVVNLEQIRCVITADEAFVMNSLDGSVMQYKTELCNRLQATRDHADGLPFEFKALELALELTCTSLDAQAKELTSEIRPVLDELTSSISTLNLERVRRFKGNLLSLTQRVQKVRDEIEHLMDDDGDMAEMYLTEKKEKMEGYMSNDSDIDNIRSVAVNSDLDNIPSVGLDSVKWLSKSAPVSPVAPVSPEAVTIGSHKLQRAFSSITRSSQHETLTTTSSSQKEDIVQLEMLLEAYFVFIDHTLSKLSSLKEYIDDTEDLINIKLGTVQNQLIQFELLLTAATFVVTCFAVVTGVFGMNFETSVFDNPFTFNWVLVISCIGCGILYSCFLIYFKGKKLVPV